jgi:YidC/Oxa1 family membrane protein insertase
MALMPKEETLTYKMGRTRYTEDNCTAFAAVSQPYGLVKPGETMALKFASFFGPKQIELLAKVDPKLEQTIDFGFFAVIAKPLLLALHGIHGFVGNYGIAIILLTIILKVLFYPLVKASSTSMHKMKKLNPEMQEMREKYKDDPMKQREEMMKFWQKHKINPMKGCFPILPQIPVFFAFYQTLFRSIELRQAPLGGWIQDLSIADPYYVTPILMAAAMFVQQKLTPTTGMDKTQEKIMMLMPVMFAGMMLTLPAGLTLYMLVNSLISIGQQQYLYRKLDKLES